MPALPSKAQTVEQHKERFQLELCRRDYDLLDAHNPQLLETIIRMVIDGISPEDIRRWARETLPDESLPIQRCFNASRYVEALQVS